MCIAPKYKCIIHVENVFIVYELKKCANQSMYFERATYMFISRGNFVASITVDTPCPRSFVSSQNIVLSLTTNGTFIFSFI